MGTFQLSIIGDGGPFVFKNITSIKLCFAVEIGLGSSSFVSSFLFGECWWQGLFFSCAET